MGFALFKSIFSRNQSLSSTGWFCTKNAQIGREIFVRGVESVYPAIHKRTRWPSEKDVLVQLHLRIKIARSMCVQVLQSRCKHILFKWVQSTGKLCEGLMTINTDLVSEYQNPVMWPLKGQWYHRCDQRFSKHTLI